MWDIALNVHDRVDVYRDMLAEWEDQRMNSGFWTLFAIVNRDAMRLKASGCIPEETREFAHRMHSSSAIRDPFRLCL